MFERRFPQSTADWLKGGKYRYCRLDGYCEELRLAFEYHGRQHTEHIDYFHKKGRSRTLVEQRARDRFVRERCSENGVLLVEIDHIVQYTQAEFVSHVVNSAERALGFPLDVEKVERFKALPFRVSKLAQLQAFAEAKGGKCLSTKYINHDSKLDWRCAAGHEWSANLNQVKVFNRWCPQCAEQERRVARTTAAFEGLVAIANGKSGQVISTEYVRNDAPMLFGCAVGHSWSAVPASIKRGHWCPYCGTTYLADPLAALQARALEEGGILLSANYENSSAFLTFKCQLEHEFERSRDQVIHDKLWCPRCAELKRTPPSADVLPKVRLSDAQWAELRQLVERPAHLQRKRVGALKSSMRDMVDAVRFVAATGCAWTALPATLPPHKNVWQFNKKWKALGILARLVADIISASVREDAKHVCE
ncbi:transposase [Paraburkholderia sp. EG287A]|uniref:transposase n=1 Tax=Paraburkholderia sp. EG287A TaxID=3237012 RepID=UPI0034D26C82